MIFDLPVLLFTLFVFIQFVILLTFLISFSRYKTNNNVTEIPVSVIVAARDEEQNLIRLLPLLYNQVHNEFEIIIINDRSNDGTYDLLMEESKTNSRLKVVTIEHVPDKMNPKKYAITLGIKAAKYETILLTDADCVPENENWISSMSANFSNADTDFNLGVSVYEKKSGFLNSFIRFESIWTAIQYIGMALIGSPYMGVGRNLAYKKSVFLNNKGFNSIIHITGGDDDLFVNKYASSKNTQVQLGINSLTRSIPKTTWSSFFIQKLRHIHVGKFYKFKHRLILGLISISQIGFWFLLIITALSMKEPYIIGAGFIIRTLILYLTFIISCKKIGIRFNLWMLLFLDFIFVFYYLSIGLRALFTKRVRWS